MSRRPAHFTEADLRRAKKVLGDDVAVEFLPDGTIRFCRPSARGSEPQETANFASRPPLVF